MTNLLEPSKHGFMGARVPGRTAAGVLQADTLFMKRRKWNFRIGTCKTWQSCPRDVCVHATAVGWVKAIRERERECCNWSAYDWIWPFSYTSELSSLYLSARKTDLPSIAPVRNFADIDDETDPTEVYHRLTNSLTSAFVYASALTSVSRSSELRWLLCAIVSPVFLAATCIRRSTVSWRTTSLAALTRQPRQQ